ncbi:MAG: ATP-binding protein [Bacillota bacterium]
MSVSDPKISALATVGELAATLVHEIKGPLAVADGYIQLLHNQIHDVRCRDICQKVRSQLEHIDHLVQGLLFLARSQRPNWRLCRADEIVKNAISLIQATALARGVEIRVTGLARAPEICADAGQMTHVILNLVLNALEAMPSGGTVWVRLRCLPSSRGLVITVADNGPGIPHEIRSRLFQPFVTTKEGGTGLGLTICRNIVSQHGGNIRIRSGKRGTIVQVSLPPADTRLVAPERSAAPVASC